MANEHDSALVAGILEAENDPALLIARLEAALPKIRDDSTYWQVLLAAWMKNGRREYQDRYRRLMSADRRNRRRAMKKASRAVYDRLPATVTLYRAVAPDEDTDRCLSWSTNPARLREMYPDREIVQRSVPKERIAFYTERRMEWEAVVL